MWDKQNPERGKRNTKNDKQWHNRTSNLSQYIKNQVRDMNSEVYSVFVQSQCTGEDYEQLRIGAEMYRMLKNPHKTSPWSRMRLVVRRYVLNDSEAWRWNKILKKQQQPIIWFNATLMLPTLSLKAAVHCLIRKEHRFGEAGENWLHFSSAARCMKA